MAKKINKTDKAIIWGRVSTTQQEVETQVAELVTMALADGYRRENLIILKSVGASAIKQNERYKREVNNLISTMDNDSSVKCVYVWEISRIARVELTFYKMKDYFVKNKVQLIVKTPEMHLLNDDGEVDPAQEIVMSVMITLAKQEMEITKKRMKRGKERSQTHGKFGGGHLVYGYTIDDDKNILINEEETAIVRKIFHLYVDEDMNATQIFKYLNDRGHFNSNMLKASKVTKITNILKNRVYCGEYVNNRYPAIITKEQSDAAIAKLTSRKPKNYNTKNTYYGKKILRCSVCGHAMTPIRSHAQYMCRNHGHRLSVNINGADSAIWAAACILNDEYMTQQRILNEAQYRDTINNNNISIEAAKNAIQEAQSKAERAANLYVEGIYTREQFNAKNATIQAIIKERNDELVRLENANAQLKSLLDEEEGWVEVEGYGKINFGTQTITDDATRKQIIDRVVDHADVTHIDRWTRELVVHNKLGLPPIVTGTFRISTRAGKTKLSWYINGVWFNDSTWLEKRFKHY